MTRRVFTTTGWNQTGAPIDLDVIDGVQTISYLTIDKAVAACVAGDVVEPCRPGMPGFAFYDADGFPLKTVVVQLGANWTISTSITLQGGWCRLRLNGGGARWATFRSPNGVFNDVDACNLFSSDSTFLHGSNQTFNRCLFANVKSAGMSAGLPSIIRDSAILGSTHGYNGMTFMRCSIYMANNPAASAATDCVCDSTGASFAKSKGAPASVTNWSDWETTCDLRLLPTSQYATGGTSVQSGQEVYDLAGNKRKVGGALGAYEVLDDAPTHYWGGSNVRYTVDYENDSAPRCSPILAGDGTTLNTNFESTAPKRVERRAAGSSEWTLVHASDVARTRTIGAPTAGYRTAFVDSDGNVISGWTTITKYEESDVSPSGAVPAASFNVKSGWRNLDGSNSSAAPTSSSVAYVGKNVRFSEDSTQRCGKIIQEGCAHTDLGGVQGEIVLGAGSTTKTCGKLTWRGQTTTSAAALARVVPRAPAELTFKDCNITD